MTVTTPSPPPQDVYNPFPMVGLPPQEVSQPATQHEMLKCVHGRCIQKCKIGNRDEEERKRNGIFLSQITGVSRDGYPEVPVQSQLQLVAGMQEADPNVDSQEKLNQLMEIYHHKSS